MKICIVPIFDLNLHENLEQILSSIFLIVKSMNFMDSDLLEIGSIQVFFRAHQCFFFRKRRQNPKQTLFFLDLDISAICVAIMSQKGNTRVGQ